MTTPTFLALFTPHISVLCKEVLPFLEQFNRRMIRLELELYMEVSRTNTRYFQCYKGSINEYN